MGIQTRSIEPHWNYFLAIERDVDELSRFVEFDSKNFDCFSIEIARIILASSAEVDVVCKQICAAIDPASTADNIGQYRNQLKLAFPSIPQFDVRLPRFGLQLTPWDEWKKKNGVPLWWTAYNKIKHHRHSEYPEANLKNALNSVAGLFIMVLHLYREKAQQGELLPSPRLFKADDAYITMYTYDGPEMGINYNL